MWSPGHASGPLALLRVSLAEFSATPRAAAESAYRPLPAPKGFPLQNRFVGEYLLYGAGEAGYRSEDAERSVHLVRFAKAEAPRKLELGHTPDRIEVMADGAVIVGARGTDLVFSSLSLGDAPKVEATFVLEKAAQGESRSHGFFFRGDADGSGMLGLPVLKASEPGSPWAGGSAEVVFLRASKEKALRRVGSLAARPPSREDDGCIASCVDWYGDARPIFYKARVFALLGYELVEGVVAGESLREVGRADFLVGSALVPRTAPPAASGPAALLP